MPTALERTIFFMFSYAVILCILGRKVQAGIFAIQTDCVMAAARIWFVRGGRDKSKSAAAGCTSELGHVLPEAAGDEPSARKL